MLNKVNKSVGLRENVALNFACHAILALMLEMALKRYSIWLLN